MGGVGSGGVRAGSGQKGKSRKLRALQGNAGHRPLPPPLPSAPIVLEPPERLTPKEVEYWNELSPHAIEAGTLVPATVATFVLLCKCHVMADEMHATMLNDGLTVIKYVLTEEGAQEEKKIHPLVSPHRNLVQRIESLSVKYKVCPLGKPMDTEARKKPAPKNPWAVVSHRA